jgi:hypothetical protein
MTVLIARSPEAKSKVPDWGKKSPTLHTVAHGECVGVDSGADTPAQRPIYFFGFDLCALKTKFLDSTMVLEVIRTKGEIMPLCIID